MRCKSCGCYPVWIVRTVEAVAIVAAIIGLILLCGAPVGCVTSTQLCVECGDYGVSLNRTMDTSK